MGTLFINKKTPPLFDPYLSFARVGKEILSIKKKNCNASCLVVPYCSNSSSSNPPRCSVTSPEASVLQLVEWRSTAAETVEKHLKSFHHSACNGKFLLSHTRRPQQGFPLFFYPFVSHTERVENTEGLVVCLTVNVVPLQFSHSSLIYSARS